ncbi:hypothetical protein BT96DRAFT_1005038 [Gymnopus androsaceus JB14]|uniref:DUF6534 domain-containing protein n=1 Tax=Gymnopus androsaceus JB14 TaxID=1447944 RepID=A0A6A4GQS7_9AGAR|nr:hypothetical protein BT96DRAFT_1005038 [Gymnopus androsaceus JB14]
MSTKKNWIVPVVIACLSISGWCISLLDGTHSSNTQADLGSQSPPTYGLDMVGGGADVLITSSMIYYLDLRFRIELHKTQQNHASYHAPRRFRRLIVRTVECNLLSLFAQTICYWSVITDMTLAKVYTFSLLVSLNCRHSDNGSGNSNGGFSSSRREGDVVELTVLHTSSFQAPGFHTSNKKQPAIIQEQTKGPTFDDSYVVLSPI